ncbi:hypothetical protein CDIK_1193 [Cucumispora dikerogammari]|nr:hypothetical protein CDIK_1193 [Cucumispora dikerogammari]
MFISISKILTACSNDRMYRITIPKPSPDNHQMSSALRHLSDVSEIPLAFDSVEIPIDFENYSKLKMCEKSKGLFEKNLDILLVEYSNRENSKTMFLSGLRFTDDTCERIIALWNNCYQVDQKNQFKLILKSENQFNMNPLILYIKNNPSKSFKLYFIFPSEVNVDIRDRLKTAVENIEIKLKPLSQIIEQSHMDEEFNHAHSLEKIISDIVKSTEELEYISTRLKTYLIDYFYLTETYFCLQIIKKVSDEKRLITAIDEKHDLQPSNRLKTKNHQKLNVESTLLLDETIDELEKAGYELSVEIKQFLKEKIRILIESLNISIILKYKIFQIFDEAIYSCLDENPYLLTAIITQIKNRIIESSKFVTLETPVLKVNRKTGLLMKNN